MKIMDIATFDEESRIVIFDGDKQLTYKLPIVNHLSLAGKMFGESGHVWTFLSGELFMKYAG